MAAITALNSPYRPVLTQKGNENANLTMTLELCDGVEETYKSSTAISGDFRTFGKPNSQIMGQVKS